MRPVVPVAKPKAAHGAAVDVQIWMDGPIKFVGLLRGIFGKIVVDHKALSFLVDLFPAPVISPGLFYAPKPG